MLVIGLTGGIGSGKTTVANLFAKLGVPIIDTDVIAREVVLPGSPGLKKIVRHFGKQILDAKQQLDRKKLGQIVFQNKAEKIWLEQLLHPLIRQQVRKQVRKLRVPYCLVVIPLLVESKKNPLIQRVLVVDSPRARCLARVLKRDKLTRQQVLNIMRSQATRQQRLAAADAVIRNNKDLKYLRQQVKKLHLQYLREERRV